MGRFHHEVGQSEGSVSAPALCSSSLGFTDRALMFFKLNSTLQKSLEKAKPSKLPGDLRGFIGRAVWGLRLKFSLLGQTHPKPVSPPASAGGQSRLCAEGDAPHPVLQEELLPVLQGKKRSQTAEAEERFRDLSLLSSNPARAAPFSPRTPCPHPVRASLRVLVSISELPGARIWEAARWSEAIWRCPDRCASPQAPPFLCPVSLPHIARTISLLAQSSACQAQFI